MDENYHPWKVLPDGRVAGVSKPGNFTYGKSRIMVGCDEVGYTDAY
jgi:hypothetical protein